MDEMDGLFETSNLPDSSNFNAINQWYIEMMKRQVVE